MSRYIAGEVVAEKYRLVGTGLTVLGTLTAIALRSAHNSAQSARHHAMLGKGLVSALSTKPERDSAVLGSTQATLGQAIATGRPSVLDPPPQKPNHETQGKQDPKGALARPPRTKPVLEHEAARSTNRHEDFGF
jgi:hypothetical protein